MDWDLSKCEQIVSRQLHGNNFSISKTQKLHKMSLLNVWIQNVNVEWDFSFDFHICQYNDLQGTVTGLKPGRCYEFEIVAISQEGESRPTKITDPVTTSESSSRPSPPLNVEVVEARNTSILLKWSQPLSDGNSPIIFYLIEKRDNAGSWSKAVQCSVQDLGVKVQFPHFPM